MSQKDKNVLAVGALLLAFCVYLMACRCLAGEPMLYVEVQETTR